MHLKRVIRDFSRRRVKKAAEVGHLLPAYPDCAGNKSPTEIAISDCCNGRQLRKNESRWDYDNRRKGKGEEPLPLLSLGTRVRGKYGATTLGAP